MFRISSRRLYILLLLFVYFWMIWVCVLFIHSANSTSRSGASFEDVVKELNVKAYQLKDKWEQQKLEQEEVLRILEEIKHKDDENPKVTSSVLGSDVIIPVLMIACNRVTVSVALDSVLNARGADPERRRKFPIIVSQDCGDKETAKVINKYKADIHTFMQQVDQSEVKVPKNKKSFVGYFKIARHYGWALNQIFQKWGYDQVIIVEDDLEVAEDFFEYFEATLWLLRSDPSLWCISAWNDNGKKGLVNEMQPELLYRSDFFGGLGWMMTRELWQNELMAKWPKSYWDDWMRRPEQRKGRACIRPEISRTKTFGKVGISKGLFFENHLKFIELCKTKVNFTQHDLGHLVKAPYDSMMDKNLSEAQTVSLAELKANVNKSGKALKIIYNSANEFKRASKVLGVMDDFKSGVPRMAYRGTVSTMHKGIRVYLTPWFGWKGYNENW